MCGASPEIFGQAALPRASGMIAASSGVAANLVQPIESYRHLRETLGAQKPKRDPLPPDRS